MSTNSIILLCVVVGWALLWFIAAGTAIESLIDFLMIVGGGFLLVRACLLRFGRARPSRRGGYTALGICLTGIGLVVLGMEQLIETFAPALWWIDVPALLALFLGILLEARAGLRRKDEPIVEVRSNKR